MEHLGGIVDRITYANEETGYSVIKVRVGGYADLVTVVGNMASVFVGTVVEVRGFWVNNPKFGRQFEAKEWEEKLPASIYGIEKYLGSGLIKGIGPVFAKKIVNRFGEKTLDILETCPDQLLEIEGIGHRRVNMIKAALVEQKEIKSIMVFLQSHEISTAFGHRIYKAYGQDSIDVITNNPYKLADDIFGVGFKTADALAQKLGVDQESYMRCRSGVFYVLSKLSDDGHCFATVEQLAAAAGELLHIGQAKVVMTIDHLVKTEEIIKDGEAHYLPPFFFSEEGVARRIQEIWSTPSRKAALNRAAPTSDAPGFVYDNMQEQAISLARQSKIMILTGGPGTGKTTTIKGILRLYDSANMRVLLAAPTGRAAKRMSEATGKEAKTIHRLLECKPPQGYRRHSDNPLEGDVLIIDEASMIDIILMYNLLKAIPDAMTVIIVGDVDQLPSVGAGHVLSDLIESGTIPVVKLQQIFRQARGSQIITNAHRVNQGQLPDLSGGRHSNFFFIKEQKDIPKRIIELTVSRLPRYYGVDPLGDIQVLTPMQRTETGAANLNSLMQAALNSNQPFLKRGATEYRLRDKVMQIRNNYDKEVFNGDIGQISAIDLEEKTLTVSYDGQQVDYEVSELDELVLAYATTIHKAQGSEYPVVIIPVSFSHHVMLQRNLLYTGITRARRLVVLVGDQDAIHTAVRNAKVKSRNTNLARRLQERLSN